SKENILKAEKATKEKLTELGLEISVKKTRIIDFRHDDFDFLGFTFGHWRKRKKDGSPYYLAKPKDETWKDFRSKIKDKTQKSLTFSQEVWVNRVNPVIRGKVNYFLTIWKAVKENEGLGMKCRCIYNTCKDELLSIDSYVRRRLRVAMIHNHPTQRKGWAMSTKWNNEFFARIGLVAAFQYYYGPQFGHTMEDYIIYMKEKGQKKHKRALQRAKEKGREYFTPDTIRKMDYA